jgi:simple sugar transport system substrate-binding protein
MKNFVAILTAALLICGGTAFSEPITKLKANSDIRIAILAHFSHVPAWVPVQKGIDDAAKSLGIKVEVSGPSDFSVAKQVTMFQGKIAAGVDAIASTMPDSQAFNNVTRRPNR